MSNGFLLPELILESVIRDGIQNVKIDTTIIPDLFAQLTRAYNTQKYGMTEIIKIQTLINTTPLPVIFSYHDVDSKSPCISIMVGSDNEDKRGAHLDDFEGQMVEAVTDVDELAALVRVTGIIPTAYDPLSGKISVLDSVDLSNLYNGLIYTDASNVDHILVNGSNNFPGEKCFFIEKNATVDISSAGIIKSSLDYEVYDIKGVIGDENIVIGVHSKDALTTKYLYILVKYFLISRKFDIINRGFYNISYSGSDFNRDSQFVGDRVFTRFLTMTGKIDDTWRADKVQLIDRIIIEAEPVE